VWTPPNSIHAAGIANTAPIVIDVPRRRTSRNSAPRVRRIKGIDRC
jgi:hypothetical protein